MLAALFTIGAVLVRSQMNSTTRSPRGDYVPVALIRLVLHPLQRFTLTWWCCWRPCRAPAMWPCWPSALAPITDALPASSCCQPYEHFFVFGSRGVAHLMVPQGGGSRQAGADPTESGEVEKTGSQIFG